MEFEKVALYLANPLVLVGFTLSLLFGLYRALVKSKRLPPVEATASSRILRLLLHYGFVVAVLVIFLGFGLEVLKRFPQLVTAPSKQPVAQHLPQKTRWGVLDGKGAGIFVFEDENLTKAFIPWAALKPEIESNLFPQIAKIPIGSVAQVVKFQGKNDWVVQVAGTPASPIAQFWFGSNPKNHWIDDGLIRVGIPDPKGHSVPVVWGTFQRYSDGTYRRVK